METGADWAASALFSPSKARAQQAQARDWAFVDAWLSKKFGARRLPAFERNEDTLRVLIDLATLNDVADEQRSLVDRVEKAAYQAMVREANVAPDLHQLVLQHVDQSEVLDELARLTVLLDSPSTSLVGLAGRIIELQNSADDVVEQREMEENQIHALERQRLQLNEILKELKDAEPPRPEELIDETNEWTKKTKTLRAKGIEYEQQLSNAKQTKSISLSVQEISNKVASLQAQKSRLADLESQVAVLEGLPRDPKAARAASDSDRRELLRLMKERDSLFENLVTS